MKCEHGKRKYFCVACGGGGICKHGRRRNSCKDCEGTSICKHGRQKQSCKDCGGSSVCEHGRQRSHCIDCKGSSICKHGRSKQQCKDCGGSSICKHDKRKDRCKECGGSSLCKSEWCTTIANSKYNGYCMPCCVHLFPDIPVCRNYKTKENEVVSRIKETFPGLTWVHDKRITDGCSTRRPDLLVDLGSHVLVIEVDEHKHVSYDTSCENKRLMQISQDVGHRPMVFIRFNPDSYVNQNGVKIRSCWIHTKLGVATVPSTRRKEWDERIQCLMDTIRHWFVNTTEKTVEVVELFY